MKQSQNVNCFSEQQAEELAWAHYGVRGKAGRLPGEMAENFFIKANDGRAFTIKIAHPDEPSIHLEMQNAMMQHLQNETTGLQLPNIISNLSKEHLTIIKDGFGKERYLRMMTWVDGRTWANVNPHSPELLFSLGIACGKMCSGLRSFDHPGAHTWHKWDLAQAAWVGDYLHLFEPGAKVELVRYFFDLFKEKVLPVIPALRKGVVYNDANDHNILVSEDRSSPQVTGFIDFGDAIYTCYVNDLAIAIAYAVMNQPLPLEAAGHVVKGFHAVFPLQEEEVSLIYALVATRLLLTLTIGAINAVENPENDYLMVSQQQAWDLLRKWRFIHSEFAGYSFRWNCAWEPCPKLKLYREWVDNNMASFHPVMDLSGQKVAKLDLSVSSLDLGNTSNFTGIRPFEKTITRILEESEADAGIGGYGEIRPFYTTDAFTEIGNSGPRWRTVHLGVDVWTKAGAEVFSPLSGIVHGFQNNDGERNYGPTIVLEHNVNQEFTFYTLYGHLSESSIKNLKVGRYVEKGEVIARIGSPPENGNWPAHLHFQVILNIMDWQGDFPGVAFPEEAELWLNICPDPLDFFSHLGINFMKAEQELHEIIGMRKSLLGKSLSISYKQPLHIVRGFMQHLYDDKGRRYLDTVNNVSHVGHEHPEIVKAAQRQAAVLNTNTRYLHHEIALYAVELLAKFPPELCVVHFVNSGSEANELALRMAKAYSGGTEMIVVQSAYHGNTNACIDISSYKFDGKGGCGAPPHVHVVPMPDTFRGLYRNPGIAGGQYAAYVIEAISRIQNNDKKVCAFVAESILSCGGQIVLPEGYLQDIYQEVRKAGGVCIADEVQVGFGRVGEAFWGFELQVVVPDIVTLGKPIGNGHPLGAVVTTRKVADAFANGMEYFNTFGGNPVSCVIGRKVLQIIREDKLQQNALDTGNFLKKLFTELSSRHSIIGDVRGHGLFLGMELVRGKSRLEPATEEAAYLVNRMREFGFLMSTDGPFENVIKIKPPLCFNKSDALLLTEFLDQSLRQDFLQ